MFVTVSLVTAQGTEQATVEGSAQTCLVWLERIVNHPEAEGFDRGAYVERMIVQ